MANFISIFDPDSERRNGFIEKIKPLLPPYDGLTISECSSGSLATVWAAGDRAPVTCSFDEKGCAVIWGDAIYPGSNRRANAAELRGKWTDPHKKEKPFFSGYYGAVVYNPSCGLLAGADLLGVFPVYYYTSKDVLLVGSSPELFRYHRSFTAEFDPAGLVGILLTMHLINGRTLLQGVKRLSAGHLLCWKPGNEAVEVRQYELPVSNKYFSLPFSAHVDLLDEAIEAAIRRHVSEGDQHNLLLSGGMDSRMIAGYMGEMGSSPFALTFGVEADQEARCAKKVARSLHLRHRVAEIPYELYSTCARQLTDLEHIASGFSELVEWGVPKYLTDLQPRVVMGHLFDAVVGTPLHELGAYDPKSKTMSFETFFRNINRCGFSPDILRRLLKREVFGDLVQQTIEQIKTMYESFSDMESQRAWCFNLYNRQRFHVGNGAFPLSFRSWPVIPALDYDLLCCTGSMPASTIPARRAQIDLMASRFPKLAALPLDRNSRDCEPLRPRLGHQIRRALISRLGLLNGRKPRNLYYERVYDINNAGWQAVRRDAEPCREKLGEIMDLKILNTLLPAPDETLQFKNGIVEGSSRKLLVSLLLWAGNNPLMINNSKV